MNTTSENLALFIQLELWGFDCFWFGFGTWVFFALLPGSRILLLWCQTKANILRLLFSSSVLHPSFTIWSSREKQSQKHQAVGAAANSQSLSVSEFRDYLQPGHFLGSLLFLTFFFLHGAFNVYSYLVILPFFSSALTPTNSIFLLPLFL